MLEPKITLLNAGIVVLLDRVGFWKCAVSAEYTGGDATTRIEGATTNGEVVALTRRFVEGETGDLLREK